MNTAETLSPVDWARRVNQSWIVRHGLAERAEEWLNYLDQRNDDRLDPSCLTAQAMSWRRDRSEDPKPWFYAGLFSRATAQEAKQFLANHRLTPATVPALWHDEDVEKWIAQISPETQKLLERLRTGLAECANRLE
jgi:hypothetical protein